MIFILHSKLIKFMKNCKNIGVFISKIEICDIFVKKSVTKKPRFYKDYSHRVTFLILVKLNLSRLQT